MVKRSQICMKAVSSKVAGPSTANFRINKAISRIGCAMINHCSGQRLISYCRTVTTTTTTKRKELTRNKKLKRSFTVKRWRLTCRRLTVAESGSKSNPNQAVNNLAALRPKGALL